MTPQADRPLAPSAFVPLVERLVQRGDTPALIDLLDERHSIYDEQRSQTIVRMRGWMLIQLSRGELPAGALPFVLEELETSLDAYLVGAAAIALRAWPRPSPDFAPFVLRALDNIRGHDQPLSFGAYGEYADGPAVSCAVHELLLTAAWLGRDGDALIPRLRAWDAGHELPPRLREDVRSALRAIQSGSARVTDRECCPSIRDLAWRSWLPSARRQPTAIEKTTFEDQNGDTVTCAAFFAGCPTIVAFFYTRCDNPLKCSLTIWKLAQVQKALEARGLAGRIRTAAITYDPAFDRPDRLKVFGRNRELRMDPDNRLLRPLDGIAPLRSHFGLGVSFAAGLVNRHRIEMYLLDRHGRIARSFQRLHWDPEQVVLEASRLLSEPEDSAPTFRHGLSTAGPIGAIAVACLPKCPICWSAYLSSAGLTAVAGNAYSWTYQLVGFLLVAHLASVFWRARSTGRWLGFSLSLAGTVLLLTWSRWDPAIQPLATVLVAAGAVLTVVAPSFSWMTRLPLRAAGTREQSSS